MARIDSEVFENEVRRVVNAIYGLPGAPANATVVDGKERDGVIFGRRHIVAFEATRDRSKEKAIKDGQKLKDLCELLRQQHSLKAVSGIFVTEHSPTADQCAVIDSFGPDVTATSLADLRREIVDSDDYLAKRENYPFGSAVDPDADDPHVKDHFSEEYISLDFTETGLSGSTSTVRNVQFILDSLNQGKTVILTGAFGAGKSMTAREVHRRLAKEYKRDPIASFPVTLNLREHKGQTDPVEAIHRHCRNIGFGNPDDIISAWRSGSIHLILDGFDEISTHASWRGDADAIKDIRRSAMGLIRNFVKDHYGSIPKQRRGHSGVFILGRHNVFDSDEEMTVSLGVEGRRPDSVAYLRTDEFTQEQVGEYLEKRGLVDNIPDWFPGRPLLLGHLASTNFLDSIPGSLYEVSPAVGWDYLLNMIAQRESLLEDGFTPQRVREVLERLASISRLRGYVQQADLARVYTEITGNEPNDSVFHVLQRLPGLGNLDSVDGGRQFIDEDLAAAAMAGDLVSAIQTRKFIDVFLDQDLSPAPVLTVEMASEKLVNIPARTVLEVGRSSMNQGASGALAFDILRVATSLDSTLASQDGYTVSGTHFQSLDADFGDGDLSWIWFNDCIIESLHIPRSIDIQSSPRFQSCSVMRLTGIPMSEALVGTVFHDTKIDEAEKTSFTTSGILADTSVTTAAKIAMTILKKGYAQTGSGRRIESLYRGVGKENQSQARRLTRDLVRAGYFKQVKSGTQQLAIPVRSKKAEVMDLLNGVRPIAQLEQHLGRT